jgi:hypothetical protein
MAFVENEARDFEIIAECFAYEQRQQSRFLSISAILNEQSDKRLLNNVVQLQTTIREKIAHLQIAVIESPDQGNGLYLYPKETLHCTLFFDPRLSVTASQEDLDYLLENHPWRLIATSEFKPLMAYPRWFYSRASNADPLPTTTFSLQLHFNAEEFGKIRDGFLKSPLNGALNPCKVRRSAIDKWVRGTINIARFLSDRSELLPHDLNRDLCDLYAKLNRDADKLPATRLDALSLSNSNAWLSAPSSIVQVYRLS